MSAYYNEIDPFAAKWLRELIKAGHIAEGEVDERSIEDVHPSDLQGFTQCHFFAGIGVWSYALRRAGWLDDRPVWTGSCPCQPFSAAGKRGGVADERHLWPAWFHLIEQCRPSVVFGEQVAASIRHGWLDLVQSDLEGIGYAVGAHGLAACNLGAPHQRKRLYFVADNTEPGRTRGRTGEASKGALQSGRLRDAGSVLADTHRGGTSSEQRDHCEVGQKEIRNLRTDDGSNLLVRSRATGVMAEQQEHGDAQGRDGLGRGSNSPELEHAIKSGLERLAGNERDGNQPGRIKENTARPVAEASFISFWADAEWLHCRDGKSRPVEPGTFPLAHGATNRVGRLRGYGNAIVAPVAEAFIRAYIESESE